MDYGLLPPETNSTRMYSGPGAEPMLTAAAAWDALAAQLAATAAECSAVISGLADAWRGPSAQAMTSAATRYQAWLTATAAQAESTAGQARRAAQAYETAFAAIVPPAAVAANRALLARLAATNTLGQNAAAIMAAESAYLEMWARDTAAMLTYEATSAQAAALQPFTVLGDLGDPSTLLGQLDEYAQSFLSSGPYQIPLSMLSLFTALWTLAPVESELGQIIATTAPAGSPQAVSAPTAAAGAVIRAQLGAGRQLGPLRIPPSWAQPSTTPVAPSAVPLAVAEDTNTLPMLLPPAGVPRGGTPPKRERPQPEYGGLVRFVTRPPAGG